MTVLSFADRMTRHRIVRTAVCLASLALASACEDVAILAPTGSELTLVTNAASLPANGSLEITAIVLRGQFAVGEQGNTGVVSGGGPPVRDDTVVTFVATLGRIVPAEAKTRDGKATVTLFGDGRTGTAKVTAFSGPAFSELDITISAAASGASR
jgi:hypothetical protein